MKFIVVGAGDVGCSLSGRLAKNRHDVVLIDLNDDTLSKITTTLDVQPLPGNGCSPEILSKAGIHTADYVVSVADIDQVNISVCLISKLMNPEAKRIARIRDISLVHNDIPEDVLKEYFDLIINPDQAAINYMLQSLRAPGAKELVDFGDGQLRLIGLRIMPASPILNRSLASLKEYRENMPVLLIAIKRRNRLIVPTGNDQVKLNDVIYAISTPAQTARLFELAGKKLIKPKRVMLWGNGQVARSLSVALEQRGVQVKLIVDPDQDLPSVDVFDDLKKTLILKGRGTDQSLLLEENIGEFDSFIAVTRDEADNIIAALLAKRLGAKTCMALLNSVSYLPLVSAVGVDVAVSSRLAAATAIFNHIHAESLISEISIADQEAGFVEFYANADLPFIDMPIKSIKFPYGIIVAAILRKGRVIIPKGSDMICEGDRVAIFVLRSAFKKLEKMLKIKLELLL
ncbi:MAG: Trk system potassium transporter TrkA [Candidatus Dadabacteria bacterium]|nr:MAG: Trk system potassium transporter TrkA [Candidatus Dadabacteria bacterium]